MKWLVVMLYLLNGQPAAFEVVSRDPQTVSAWNTKRECEAFLAAPERAADFDQTYEYLSARYRSAKFVHASCTQQGAM